MSETTPDVLLITDDPQLRERVSSRRPVRAKLQFARADELAGASPVRARQVWVDLDAGASVPSAADARRVYFHSRPHPPADELPPGLFIPKSCSPAVFDVLWAGAEVSGGSALGNLCSPPGLVLPTWILDFQELNLKALCRRCATGLGPRLGYADVSLYLHRTEGLLTLAETTHARPIDLSVRLDATRESLMANVALTRQWMQTDRVSHEFAQRQLSHRGDRPYRDEVCLIAPLACEDQLWGVLNFSGVARTAVTEVGLPLDDLFRFLARALQHACLYDQARVEARVDTLTGLYNVRWITEGLEREIRRAQRFNTPLSALMIDLDGLKAINDRYGHAAGDSLLKHVAGRISAVLRQFDGAARVGGDEFVVMLPATELAGARQVARRLAESIREDAAFFHDCRLPITVSIGVAEWRAGWSARELIDAADQAMYLAKGQGRDRLVCQASDRPPLRRLGGPVVFEPHGGSRFVGHAESATAAPAAQQPPTEALPPAAGTPADTKPQSAVDQPT